MLEKSFIELQQLINLVGAIRQRGCFSELERDTVLSKLRDAYSSVLIEELHFDGSKKLLEPSIPEFTELEPDLVSDDLTDEIPQFFVNNTESEKEECTEDNLPKNEPSAFEPQTEQPPINAYNTSENEHSAKAEQPFEIESELNSKPLQGIEFSLDIEDLDISVEPRSQLSLFDVLSDEDMHLISQELCDSDMQAATKLIEHINNLKDFDLTILYIQEHFSGKSASKSVAKLVEALSTKFI